MTLADVVVVLIAVVAAIAGYRWLGGGGRGGRLLGVLAGAGVGLALGVRVAASGQRSWGLLAVGAIGGILLGGLVGGWIGGLVGRLLARTGLGFVDRVLGALTAAAGALVLLWVLAVLVPGVVEPLGGGGAVLSGVDQTLPTLSTSIRALLAGPGG